MDRELDERLDRMEEKRDQQHADVLQGISSIRETCASCQMQLKMHSGRLVALDDLRDGAVPRLQQHVASLKTKVAAYAGIASAIATAIVFGIVEFVKSFFTK